MALASSQIWTPGDTPGAAPTGKKRLYINSSGDFKVVDDAGIETDVGGSGSSQSIFTSASTSMHSFNSVGTQYPEWDSTFRADTQFTHSDTSNAQEITVNVTTELLVSYQIVLNTNLTAEISVTGMLMVGINFQQHTDVYSHVHDVGKVRQVTLQAADQYLSVSAGDKIKLRMQIANNDNTFGDVGNIATGGGQITVKAI